MGPKAGIAAAFGHVRSAPQTGRRAFMTPYMPGGFGGWMNAQGLTSESVGTSTEIT